MFTRLTILHSITYAFVRDPDPFEIFSFQFQLPEHQLDDNNNDENVQKNINTTITIHLHGYKTDADAVWQSTGLTLWRASQYLCEYQLEHHRKLFWNNKRTLELGAGLGLNGILAWKLMQRRNDSSHVCITDGDSDALVQLRENVNRNRTRASEQDAATATGTDDCKVSCHQLIWGKESASQFLTQIAKNDRYDIILASDIIYSLVIVEPLWQTVQLLLKKKGGVFVMAYARREVPVSIELVLKASMEHGFSYELVKEDDVDGIWVYEFRHADDENSKT